MFYGENMEKLVKSYKVTCSKLFCTVTTLSKRQAQSLLFLFGFGLLFIGLESISEAQRALPEFGGEGVGAEEENDVVYVLKIILWFLEGSFGALIMIIAGIFAIFSAAFGQYRAALGLFVVAIGAFLLRTLVKIFFGDYIGDSTRQNV